MLLVDTGPIVADADADDPDHAACRELLEGSAEPLVTTELVIAEAAHLLRRKLGPVAESALVADVVSGRFTIESLSLEDWRRTEQLVHRYEDLPLGVTDASLIAVAERHRLEGIATLDRRHFFVVRPKHRPGFAIRP